MSVNNLIYRAVKPDPTLTDLVESFWMLHNPTDQEQDVIVLPDGRIDLFFMFSPTVRYYVLLRGLDSEPGHSKILPKSTTFAVSLTLLAAEYLLNESVSDLVNKGAVLPVDFWGITANDLIDFDAFCDKVSARIRSLRQENVDERKRRLVHLLYSSNGSLPVKELADMVHWSSRQINRYFTHWFGLSLKAYCNILRFRASFGQLKEGKLFPEQNFTDQAHFIHEVEKYSGVSPKKLSQNSDDRFIQFSLLPKL